MSGNFIRSLRVATSDQPLRITYKIFTDSQVVCSSHFLPHVLMF